MTLSSIANDLNRIVESVESNAAFVLAIIFAALFVYITNRLCRNRLNMLGIIPRQPIGLAGLIFAPWLHASLSHWFMNSLFFFLIASMSLVILNRHDFIWLCLFLSVGSGFLTWVFARPAIHLGASGVVMGLWGYLLVYAIRNPSFIAIALAMSVLYFLGGMIVNIFPKNDRSSWEAHLFGAVIGVLAALLL
jgi:membrane associated rhomboid family serine protease